MHCPPPCHLRDDCLVRATAACPAAPPPLRGLLVCLGLTSWKRIPSDRRKAPENFCHPKPKTRAFFFGFSGTKSAKSWWEVGLTPFLCLLCQTYRELSCMSSLLSAIAVTCQPHRCCGQPIQGSQVPPTFRKCAHHRCAKPPPRTLRMSAIVHLKSFAFLSMFIRILGIYICIIIFLWTVSQVPPNFRRTEGFLRMYQTL